MHRGIVIIAGLSVAFCNYGVLQAYGSLFTATIEKFAENRGKTSLVHSVLIGTSLGAGVIGGYLIKRINLIVVSAIGSVLLPLGFIISYWASSVTYLTFSIGLVAGIGISFTYVSAVVVISSVTPEKHKTTVLSLQNVACGIPGVVVPYLFSWLTTTYGLSGTLLIYGGLTLNNIAATIVFSGVRIKDDQRDVQEYNCDGQTLDSRNDKNGNYDVQSLGNTNDTHDNCDTHTLANRTDTHDNNDVHTLNNVIHENGNCWVQTLTNRNDEHDKRDVHMRDSRNVRRDANYDTHKIDNPHVRGDDNIEINIETDENEYQIEGSMSQSQTICYVLFAIAVPIVMANIGGFLAIYQDVGVFKGLSAEETVTCIVVYNVTSTASRFLPLVFLRLTGNPFMTPIVASVFGVLGQGLLRLTSKYYLILIGYAFTGITDGGTSASISVVIFKILNQDSQAVGFGLVLTLIGILATGSGPLYGAIFDQTESYALVLNVTTSIFALGSVVFVGCFISYGSCCYRTKRNVKLITNKNKTLITAYCPLRYLASLMVDINVKCWTLTALLSY